MIKIIAFTYILKLSVYDRIITSLICICMVFIAVSSYSQSTFSVTYDFQADDIEIYPKEIIQIDNRYYILSQHICLDEPISFCAGLSKLSHSGDILNKKLFDNFYYSGYKSFKKFDNELLFSGLKSDNDKVTSLLMVDTTLTLLNSYNTDSIDHYYPLNLGMLRYRESVYVYGQKNGTDSSGIYLNKLSENNFETIWNKEYNRGVTQRTLEFDTLTDDEFVYLSNYNTPGTDSYKEFEIMRIDTAGNRVDSFNLSSEDWYKSGYNNKLTTDNFDNIYFTTFNTLNTEFDEGIGVINKIDNDLDSIHWSTKLPRDPFSDSRYYSIENIYYDKNSIIGCGLVQSESVTHSVGYILQGFIVKLSLEGKIQWIRFYRIPQQEADNITGNFEFGSLIGLIPNSYGGYTATGYSQYYNDDSILQVNNWVLSLDEKGCLIGEECEETIIIDGVNRTNHKFVNSLNEWSIMTTENVNGKTQRKTIRYKFSSDSTFIDGENYFELLNTKSKSGLIDNRTGNYYREEGGKVWKKTFEEGEELIYDFKLYTLDTFYMDIGLDTIGMHVVRGDRDTMIDGSTRKSLPLISINEDYDCNFRWIDGIGSLSGFPFDDDKCINSEFSSTLLCYSYDGKVLYENDSIEGCYLVNNITPKINELYVHPNPVKKRLNIKNLDGNFRVRIYNTIGQLVFDKEVSRQQIDVSNFPSGTYFISLINLNGKMWGSKFIKH